MLKRAYQLEISVNCIFTCGLRDASERIQIKNILSF
jgi:hypothetical protein